MYDKNLHIKSGLYDNCPSPEVPVDDAWNSMKNLLDKTPPPKSPVSPNGNNWFGKYSLLLVIIAGILIWISTDKKGTNSPSSAFKEKAATPNNKSNPLHRDDPSNHHLPHYRGDTKNDNGNAVFLKPDNLNDPKNNYARRENNGKNNNSTKNDSGTYNSDWHVTGPDAYNNEVTGKNNNKINAVKPRTNLALGKENNLVNTTSADNNNLLENKHPNNKGLRKNDATSNSAKRGNISGIEDNMNPGNEIADNKGNSKISPPRSKSKNEVTLTAKSGSKNNSYKKGNIKPLHPKAPDNAQLKTEDNNLKIDIVRNNHFRLGNPFAFNIALGDSSLRTKIKAGRKNNMLSSFHLGLQWNAPMPLQGTSDFFKGTNAKPNAYSILIPEIYISRDLGKKHVHNIHLQLNPLQQYLAGNKEVFSYTGRRSVQDSTMVIRTTKLSKASGIGISLQYNYNFNAKWGVGLGMNYSFYSRALLHSETVDLTDNTLLSDSLFSIRRSSINWAYLNSRILAGKLEFSYNFIKFKAGAAAFVPISNFTLHPDRNIRAVNGQLFIRWEIK